jgi:hypothetical protein
LLRIEIVSSVVRFFLYHGTAGRKGTAIGYTLLAKSLTARETIGILKVMNIFSLMNKYSEESEAGGTV